MKIQFLATAHAPDYVIANETVNGFDLSVIEHGGKFIGNEDTRTAGIRDAHRDENGELFVTLTQQAGTGHWRRSEWINADEYDPEKTYIKRGEEGYNVGLV